MTPFPFRRGLLDTPVAEAIRASEPQAVTFALSYLKFETFQLSAWTAMVLVAESPDLPSLNRVTRFLRGCRLLPISTVVSRRAQRILESLAPPSPLGPAEALVAATAVFHKLPLYTLDPARFGIVPGLTALQAY